jgi:hypothetical protein
MSRTTRRHLFVSLIVIALSLPVEGILLQALSSSPKDVIRTWVSGLSLSDLQEVSHDLPAYPLDYRKAVMARLTPKMRAAIWLEHIDRYIAAHPDLSSDALPVLGALRTVITPEIFGTPTADARAQVAQLADQLSSVLGKDETEYLLYRLGPRDGTFASAEPISHKLANRVRGWIVVLANAGVCDCSTGSSFCGANSECASSSGCDVDDSWPMCGWLWSEACDGSCTSRAS